MNLSRSDVQRFLVPTILAVAMFGVWSWNDVYRRSAPSDASTEKTNPFLPPDAADEAWPFVRGPRYDGRSQEIHLADSWPQEGPPILWKRLLGQGYSAFVAEGNRVYTQMQTLAGQYVVCLDADTGVTLWEHRYDWNYEAAGVYPGPRATPTLNEGRVYFAAPNGLIGCVDANTGKPLWSNNPLEKYHGEGVGFGYSCSPTVVEGCVYLPVGGKGASLVALSAATGEEIWRAGDDPASYSPVYPITLEGREVLLGYLQNALVCHDRRTGERLWRLQISHDYDEHSAWPIYREPHLWTSGPFRAGSQLRKLTLDAPPREVWSDRVLSNDVASSVLIDDHLYGFDLDDVQVKTHRTSRGTFQCVDFATRKVAWSVGNAKSRTIPPGAVGHAMVLAADGKLFLLNDEGTLILAKANPERYEELGRASVLPGEIVWTPPVLHRGRLYLRNHSHAVCVYVGEPALLDERSQATARSADDVEANYFTGSWTSYVLPVEPEFAFDVPSVESLQRWYVVQIGMLFVGMAFAGIVSLVRPHRDGVVRFTLLAVPFFLGALGTTFVSRLLEEFIFTWPLCLYTLLHAVAPLLPTKRKNLTTGDRRRSQLGVIAFLTALGVYYWLCHRLCLLFEWAFLFGYVVAWPAVVWDAYIGRSTASPTRRFPLLCLTTSLGFTIFYWAGVGLLWWKYA